MSMWEKLKNTTLKVIGGLKTFLWIVVGIGIVIFIVVLLVAIYSNNLSAPSGLTPSWTKIIITLSVMIVLIALVGYAMYRQKRSTKIVGTTASTTTATTVTPATTASSAVTTTKNEKKATTWGFWKVAGVILALWIIAWTTIKIVDVCTNTNVTAPIVREDGTIVSKQLQTPNNTLEITVTSEERKVPSASKGKDWRIQLMNSSDILEFRAVNVELDGKLVQVGKPWKYGGAGAIAVDFPRADKYFVKIINKKESKFIWFEY